MLSSLAGHAAQPAAHVIQQEHGEFLRSVCTLVHSIKQTHLQLVQEALSGSTSAVQRGQAYASN